MSENPKRNLNRLAKDLAKRFDIKDRAGLRAAIHWADAIRQTLSERPADRERGSLDSLVAALEQHLEPLDGALDYLQTEANWLCLYEQDGERAEAVEIALRRHYHAAHRALDDLKSLARAAKEENAAGEDARFTPHHWLIPVVKHLARYWRDEVRQPSNVEYRDGQLISPEVEFLQAAIRGTSADIPGIDAEVPARTVEAAARAIRSRL